MIQITAYLRDEEDLRLWRELPNKTEFLHSSLLGTTSALLGTTSSLKAGNSVNIPKLDTFNKLKESIGVKLCKHGYEKNGWSCKKGCR